MHYVQKKLYSLWSLPVYKLRPMGYTIITPRDKPRGTYMGSDRSIRGATDRKRHSQRVQWALSRDGFRAGNRVLKREPDGVQFPRFPPITSTEKSLKNF